MDELSAKVAFFEARLTLLERQFSRYLATSDLPTEKPTGPVILSCSEPGLMISKMYPTEVENGGSPFCWVGNDGPIQFVLPICPSHPLTCTLHLQPHPEVDFSAITLLVNEKEQPTTTSTPNDRMINITFAVPRSGASCLNVMLLGITSIRPSDFGENTDSRLLAARFFGATIVFD